MNYTPSVKQSREEFWEHAIQPDFPDEMAYQIDREHAKTEDPTTTFSLEAVNEIAEQFRMFLMARILGTQRKRNGLAPKHMRATVTLDWNPSPEPVNDPTVGPYFQIDHDTKIEPLDGSKRYEWRHS